MEIARRSAFQGGQRALEVAAKRDWDAPTRVAAAGPVVTLAGKVGRVGHVPARTHKSHAGHMTAHPYEMEERYERSTLPSFEKYTTRPPVRPSIRLGFGATPEPTSSSIGSGERGRWKACDLAASIARGIPHGLHGADAEPCTTSIQDHQMACRVGNQEVTRMPSGRCSPSGATRSAGLHAPRQAWEAGSRPALRLSAAVQGASGVCAAPESVATGAPLEPRRNRTGTRQPRTPETSTQRGARCVRRLSIPRACSLG